MRSILSRIVLALGLVAGLTAVGFAQTPPAQEGQDDGVHRHGGPMGKGHGMRHGRFMELRGLHRLNLSDDQREQLRALAERHREANKEERAELRELMRLRREGGELTPEQQARAQQLHETLRAAGESHRQEVLSILTPEQRTQLEQMRNEARQRREEFRQRRMQQQQSQPQ